MSHTPLDPSHSDEQQSAIVPDPEVVTKPERRHFTAEYKRRVLQEAEACTQRGAVGALLRREGLYSSHLSTWRQQRAQGELQGLTPAKRGRKADPHAAELAQLRRETERLTAQLARAELIIEVQKKLSQILGLPETPSDEVTWSPPPNNSL